MFNMDGLCRVKPLDRSHPDLLQSTDLSK